VRPPRRRGRHRAPSDQLAGRGDAPSRARSVVPAGRSRHGVRTRRRTRGGPMTGPQILTPAQAAVLLGLGKTTVVEWCQRGILPSIRIDSRWYLKRAELIRDGWLENQAVG